jgi:putative ABC transport system permease protein
MSVFKIAWRSIQHRGLGSLLTIVSMALGVMLVVAVLTIHGVVSDSFRTNSSFGYNVLMGSRGGSMQLTLSTVRYMGRPLEPIPFEYYLAFRDGPSRTRYLVHSIAFAAESAQRNTCALNQALVGGGFTGFDLLPQSLLAAGADALTSATFEQMQFGKPGRLAGWASMAIPINLGDSWARELDKNVPSFRVVGTTSEFFTELVLDVETGKKFEFAQGRHFHDYDPERGFYECVVGSQVARLENLKLGEKIIPVHGDPATESAHLHEEAAFTIVGILQPTGTPNDKAVFCNIEGFYLIDDHAKPINEGRPVDEGEPDEFDSQEPDEVDEFDARNRPRGVVPSWWEWQTTPVSRQADPAPDDPPGGPESAFPFEGPLNRQPLPVEQREVTALLIRTNPEGDEFGTLSFALIGSVNNGGFMEPTLNWTSFRPVRAQVAPQAVNPVQEVTSLFSNFVDPILWLLLGLTTVICIVSGISILVGIYNSMNQRRHEIAVMRALGANRTKVTTIMLCESILLSLAGGLLGWIFGHGLNAAMGPTIEAQTGARIGFFQFAPPIPVLEYLLPGLSNSGSRFVQYLAISPEFLLIPGLIVLAVLVGVYPAISAYRTDVAKSLGT